jgi:glutamine cyclotransferase
MRHSFTLFVVITLSLTACRTSSTQAPLLTTPAAAAQDAVAPEQTPVAPARVTNYRFEVVNTYPHDSNAFTQGLVYHQGMLYESTGLNGQSSLRRVELETGRVLRKIDLPFQYFGEGLVLFNNKFIQITWQNGIAFQYDFNSFEQLNTFRYSGEGWGITHDGRQLIMSDGTPVLRFLDPETFQEKSRVTVTYRGQPVRNLNELEYVKGEVWANIWYEDRIARIEPQTGQVLAWLDGSKLLLPTDINSGNSGAVLNGIAYDAERNRIFITGKLWPKLFEMRLVERRNEVKRGN